MLLGSLKRDGLGDDRLRDVSKGIQALEFAARRLSPGDAPLQPRRCSHPTRHTGYPRSEEG